MWQFSAVVWHDSAIICGNNSINVSDLCDLKDGIEDEIYSKYETIKRIVKETYFLDSKEKKINRYKRAAVIVQAIIMSSPLKYKDEELAQVDYFFLKQRLAFYVGIYSIIVSYEGMSKNKELIYDFGKLDQNLSPEEDDFLTSVYKDLMFAEQYGNYNILTMANVFGLLTETSSILPKYDILESKCNCQLKHQSQDN